MQDLKLAHIGVIVHDLPAFAKLLTGMLGAHPVSDEVEDPHQQARLQMFRSGAGYIEAIAPAGADSHVHTALKNHGEGLAHLCFETDDLEGTLQRVRAQGAVVFRAPAPAVLFAGRRVAFAMLPNRMIVEFVETGWEAGLKEQSA